MAWLKRNAPCVLLGAALLAAAALLLALGSGLTFFQDSWAFLMHRREFDLDAFMQPHNEHIVLIPVAIQKLLLEVFGMTSATPERLVLTAMLLVVAVLLFVYVRRRMGAWPALIAAVLLLFVGPAWQVLLWPFQMGYVGAVLFGIAMLLALDRGDRRGDIAACFFLAIAIGFSSLGIAFVAGAVVDVALRRRTHGLSRAFVPVVPLLLYGAWYLGWGHTAETHLTLKNVLESPLFMLEGLAASLSALTGIYALAEHDARPEWGPPLLIAAIVLLVVWQIRGPTFSARILPVAATTATLWLLAGFNYIPGREAYTSRYLYAGAALLLLLLADLLADARVRRPALLVAGAVALAAVGSNLVPLRDGQRDLDEQTVLARSNLAALEISRGSVDASFGLTPEIAGTSSLIDIQAGPYLEAVGEHGSPAYSLGELAAAPERGRRQADIVLGQALPLSTETAVPRTLPLPRASICATIPPGGGEVRVRTGPTRIDVPPGDRAEFSLRRFAREDHPVRTEGAPGDSTTILEIPLDPAAQPWYLQVEAKQGAAVCRD